jgi:aminoglycoside phosphotransferase (APT) family kinase protein
MHADQIDLTARTVRDLVDAQFPRWRDLPVRAVDSQGTVNAIFRIGERLAARFPLQGPDPDEVRRGLFAEAAAARRLLGRTPFPVPEPVALGEPGVGYPLPWSVQTWLPGEVATADSVAHSTAFARDLATFIRAVRAIDTGGGTFAGLRRTGRGGDLRVHDAWMNECLDKSGGFLDVPALRRIWAQLRDLPRGSAPDVTTHGDLMPGNLLVRHRAGGPDGASGGGRLAGVLDTGGLGPADPALDLMSAWHVLEAAPRAVLRSDLAGGDPAADDLTWRRGQAWAFEQAMGAAWYYAETNPAMALVGRRTLERILADPLG